MKTHFISFLSMPYPQFLTKMIFKNNKCHIYRVLLVQGRLHFNPQSVFSRLQRRYNHRCKREKTL